MRFEEVYVRSCERSFVLQFNTSVQQPLGEEFQPTVADISHVSTLEP